jgi:hypothetical protein
MLERDRSLQLQVLILSSLFGTSYYGLFMTGSLESTILSADLAERATLPAFFDIFSAYYLLVSLLFFLMAILFLWFSIKQQILSKKTDIALMVTVGQAWRIRSFIFRKTLISTFISLAGGIIGAFLLTKVVQLISGHAPPFPLVLCFVYTLAFLLVAYFSAARLTNSLLEKSFQEIRDTGLSERSVFDLEQQPEEDEGFFDRITIAILNLLLAGHLPVTRKIATRIIKRTFHLTKHYLILVFLLVTTLSVTLAGGLVVRDTSHEYLDDFYGEKLFLVTFKPTADFFLPFFEFTSVNATPYPSGQQWVDASAFKSRVGNMSRVIDDRIMIYTLVREVAGVIIDMGTEQSIGQARRTTAIVQGIDPTSLVQSWNHEGLNPVELTRGKIIIGDWLAMHLFTDPFREAGLKIFANNDDRGSFLQGPIVSTVLDPLAGGKTVYTRVEDLANLLQLDEGSRNAFLVELLRIGDMSLLEQAASEFGMEVHALEDKLVSNKGWIDKLWNLTTVLSIPSLTMLVLSMIIMQNQLLETRKQILTVLQALGAREKIMRGVLTVETKLLLFISFVSGYYVGLLLANAYLIDEPVMTLETYLLPLVVLIVSVTIVLLAAKAMVNRRTTQPPFS